MCVCVCVCLGEVVVVWQMDEETTTDSRSLLSLLPVAETSLSLSFANSRSHNQVGTVKINVKALAVKKAHITDATRFSTRKIDT